MRNLEQSYLIEKVKNYVPLVLGFLSNKSLDINI